MDEAHFLILFFSSRFYWGPLFFKGLHLSIRRSSGGIAVGHTSGHGGVSIQSDGCEQLLSMEMPKAF